MKTLVQMAKIFSDPNRLSIFALIIRNGDLCVCEICDTLNLSQSLVSRHLKQMREAGILETRQEGRWMIYSLTPQPNTFLLCWIEEVKKHVDSLPKLIGCATR